MRKRRAWYRVAGYKLNAFDMREMFVHMMLSPYKHDRYGTVTNQIVSGARINRSRLGQIKYCDDYRARWI